MQNDEDVGVVVGCVQVMCVCVLDWISCCSVNVFCFINLDAGVQVANPCVGRKAWERSQLLDRHIAGQVNESALFP